MYHNWSLLCSQWGVGADVLSEPPRACSPTGVPRPVATWLSGRVAAVTIGQFTGEDLGDRQVLSSSGGLRDGGCITASCFGPMATPAPGAGVQSRCRRMDLGFPRPGHLEALCTRESHWTPPAEPVSLLCEMAPGERVSWAHGYSSSSVCSATFLSLPSLLSNHYLLVPPPCLPCSEPLMAISVHILVCSGFAFLFSFAFPCISGVHKHVGRGFFSGLLILL